LSRAGVNFINVLRAAFTSVETKNIKNWELDYLFHAFRICVALKQLVGHWWNWHSAPGVNSINIYSKLNWPQISSFTTNIDYKRSRPLIQGTLSWLENNLAAPIGIIYYYQNIKFRNLWHPRAFSWCQEYRMQCHHCIGLS